MVRDADYFREYIECRDGTLFWKPRGIKNWDSCNAGKEIKCRSHGYIAVNLNGERFLAHRVIWLMSTGKWPKEQLDHINGNRSDNRIKNLRECNNSENNRAVGIKSSNTSGFKGVTFNKASGKYFAYIRVNYKRIHLGVWNTAKEAAVSYNKAAVEHFGEFANLNLIE